ncbi:hypothetical protein COM13_29445 [Bacillus pseudomycoides]|nr:hypothetical protein COO07_20730 [Bacillus pseudomycoides]PEK74130.1 hypothetical protein CN597_26810 [Bacillus pseudomycoides]PEN04104.1 hypothetical protein CN640_25660 [Bacillus pseudomycoides]PGB76127.1 hypothetical protein COM13_29445 [Bacillus pseudomycoides]
MSWTSLFCVRIIRDLRGHGKNSFFFEPLIMKLNNNKIHCHIHVTMYLYDRNTKKEVYKYE